MTRAICVRKYTGARLRIEVLALALFLVLAFGGPLAPVSRAEESHPGLGAESMYSEAVLAYNKKQSSEALKILDELLKANPNHLEGLELMALTLKTRGDDKKAVEVYSRLLKLKPEAERGPYHFELAVIYNKDKKAEFAKEHFQKAVDLHFNEVAAHLFLGLIAFSASDGSAAQSHFGYVKDNGNTELKAVARYYLGLVHFKNGYGAGGTYELLEARTLADEVPDSKMAQDIKAGANKVLAPFGQSSTFGNLTFLSQYDSNIALIPSGAAATQTSGKATPNLSLSGGIGRMSSPLDTIQWVASYRFSYNHTMNDQTKAYEFFGNTPSLFFNYRPLARTNGGLKIEGGYLFQNMTADSINYKLSPYSLAVDVGPFIRYQANQSLLLQLDTSIKPVTNYSDPTLSGSVLSGRLTAKGSGSSSWLNLAASVSYEKDSLQSTEWRYSAIGFDLNDTVHVSSTNTMTFMLDYLSSKYPDSSTGRADGTITARMSLIHTFNPRWSLLSDASYITNTSNVPDSYSYNRMTASLGIGVSL